MNRPIIIAPSMLAANFASLGAEARRACEAGADWLHLDIMDGHFVPNISFGPAVVAMMRKEVPSATLDVHLMIDQPERYIRDFVKAGADILTIHLEAHHDVRASLKLIQDLGCKAGLAINPPTMVKNVFPFLSSIDLLLCMTVNPGFGGQSFVTSVLDKVKEVRQFCKEQNLNIDIEVDGGVNFETASLACEAGANVFVAGTALFRESDMQAAIRTMRERATSSIASR